MAEKINKKIFSYLIISLFGIVYLLFPTINFTGDCYEYASNILHGEDLFYPHHLLFNAILYVPVTLFNITNTLNFICIINGVFAILTLLVVNAILLRRKNDIPHLSMLIIVAASFAFMRFATTAETYILPLFFSLLASRLILDKKFVFAAGLFASIACLFHQIHVFWWLGLFLYVILMNKEKRFLSIVKYLSSALIIPIIYFLVFVFTKNNYYSLVDFVFYDYFHYDNVSISFSFKAFLLTLINFIRSFVQAHGYFIPMVKQYPYMLVFAVIAICFFVIGIIKIRETTIKTNKNESDKIFAFSHLLIFFLQLIFAFLSNGNAEFMVMIPFALIIFFAYFLSIKKMPMIFFAVSLFIWNFSWGILPSHFLELNSSTVIMRYIGENNDKCYYIKKGQTVRNGLIYQNPERKINVISVKQGVDVDLDTIINDNEYLISDFVNKENFSRESLVFDEIKLSEKYNISNYDTIKYDLGEVLLVKIHKK